MAPFTEKVRRALVLKGLPFELREPGSLDDYTNWSPETGLLPVMRIDGELISDSTAILFALDKLYPEPPLLSSDPMVSEQQSSLENWADESFLWYFMQWLNFRGEAAMTSPNLEQFRETSRQIREKSAKPFRRIRRLLAWLSAGGTWERPETSLLRGLSDRLTDLTNFLGARAFFYADRVSMADLAVYSMLLTMRRDAIPGSQHLLAHHPTLVEFMRRVERETGGEA
jgi:glutathione S-transferase